MKRDTVFFLLRFAATSVLFLAGQAASRAADIPQRDSSSDAPSWTGPSIGLSVTNLWGVASVDVPGVAKLDSLSLNGPGAGLTLGYDYQFAPGLVSGGALDFNLSSAQFSMGTPFQSMTVREYGSWALRGRLGSEIGQGAFAYGTVGFSQLLGDASLQGAVTGNSGRQIFSGVVFGVGVETQFDVNMFARFEYLHGVYAGQSYVGGAFNVTPSTDSARFTLVLRGDGAGPSARRAESVVDWNGVYVGGMGGWENTRASATVPVAWTLAGLGGSGPSASAVVGYNAQEQRSVAGVEGEFSATSSKAKLSLASGDQAELSLPYGAAARFRFGALVTANTLLYADIGGVWTHATAQANVGGASISIGKDFEGFQFGMGMEAMLTQHIGARVEYIESRYAKQNYITPSSGKTQSGLVYKF